LQSQHGLCSCTFPPPFFLKWRSSSKKRARSSAFPSSDWRPQDHKKEELEGTLWQSHASPSEFCEYIKSSFNNFCFKFRIMLTFFFFCFFVFCFLFFVFCFLFLFLGDRKSADMKTKQNKTTHFQKHKELTRSQIVSGPSLPFGKFSIGA